MQAIITGLLAGFLIGVICAAYVLVRSWYVQTKIAVKPLDTVEFQAQSTEWMIMALISSASVLWGFVAAGIYHLLQNEVHFMIFSIAVSIVVILYFAFSKVMNKMDKILLSVIIIDGLGLLIPYLY